MRPQSASRRFRCRASQDSRSRSPTSSQDEGYIGDVRVTEDGAKAKLEIALKYYEGKPVIERLERVSRSGLRQYRGKDALPKVLGGLGVAIISTSKGIMTDAQARLQGVGGEVLCLVA